MIFTKPAEFWIKVKEPFDAHNDCWIWKGGRRNAESYGIIFGARPKRQKLYAHRFAYEQFYGPIPPDAVIHHNCENPSCVNPSHLELTDKASHAAYHTAKRPIKEFCSRGHPLADVKPHRNGRRRCRICGRLAGRRYYAAHKATVLAYHKARYAARKAL